MGAIPLSAVTQELPGLLAFLGKELNLTPAQLATALQADFPALAPSVANLPAVTNGWENIPGIAASPASTEYRCETYPTRDVLQRRRDSGPGAPERQLHQPRRDVVLGPLVLIIGIIVILYGLLMVLWARRSQPQLAPGRAPTRSDGREGHRATAVSLPWRRPASG